MSEARWKDRTAVVTGAGSGIGRCTAEQFAAGGGRVVVVDHDEVAASATAQALGGVAIAGSVAEPDTWTRALDAAAAVGGPDVVHLNAGLFGDVGPIDELDLDVYRRTVAANVDGVVLGVRAVVPALEARGGGAIVATASMAGVVPFPPNPVYTLTKHAVIGFVRALAPGLSGRGITINAVCPIAVDTPMTDAATAGLAVARDSVPMVPPSAVSEAVLTLAAGTRTGRCVAVLKRGALDWEFAGVEQFIGAPPGPLNAR